MSSHSNANPLRRRLGSSPTGGADTTYKYNDDGNRILQTEQVNGGAITTTLFHVDPHNHTGYAQVLEEGIDDNANGNLASAEVDKSYALGHDLLFEATTAAAGSARFFIYDGHGSTRVLVNAAGAMQQRYAYDGYGNQLTGAGSGLTGADTATTRFLYSGERTDKTGLQYLRARYYDPRSGRFTQLDPFAGNVQDPLSLHKYLYVHGDPVNFNDPTGMSATWNQLFGYEVEDAIETEYRNDPRYGGNNVTFGNWARLPGIFRAKPDILDHDRRKYMEIKPLSPSGLIAAIGQMAARELQFRPQGYSPDRMWHVQPSVIYPWGIPTIYFNVAGVLFYTDAVEVAFDYVAITSLEKVWALVNSGRLAYTVEVALGRIVGMAGQARAIDSARMNAGISSSFGLGLLGFGF